MVKEEGGLAKVEPEVRDSLDLGGAPGGRADPPPAPSEAPLLPSPSPG